MVSERSGDGWRRFQRVVVRLSFLVEGAPNTSTGCSNRSKRRECSQQCFRGKAQYALGNFAGHNQQWRSFHRLCRPPRKSSGGDHRHCHRPGWFSLVLRYRGTDQALLQSGFQAESCSCSRPTSKTQLIQTATTTIRSWSEREDGSKHDLQRQHCIRGSFIRAPTQPLRRPQLFREPGNDLGGTGTFTMGSPPTNESGRSSNEIEHSVTFNKGFYLGKYEVTQAQYAAVMTGNGNGLSSSPS